MQRPQQLAAMFLLGAFLVGGTLGFTVDRMWTAPPSTLDAFAAELSLSDAQRAAVDSILDERHRVVDSITAPLRPAIENARDAARDQIRQRLTTPQRAKFESYLERMRTEAKRD